MTNSALSRAKELLDGATIDDVASWADDYRRHHPQTGPWHYINIPLEDSKLDMTRECPNSNCVIAKTEQFLAVLKDPRADRAKKAEALKFVIHFIGDLHQPLHDENDDDRGGNRRRVIFDGHRDNLHWVWDTGLLRDIDRDPEMLAAHLEVRITGEARKEWEKGSIEDWALEAHKLAQSVAYGDLGKVRPAVVTHTYEQKADAIVELQLEKAGVRLAFVLDQALR